MLDMLSIVSYNRRYLLTWTDFSLWTTKIYFLILHLSWICVWKWSDLQTVFHTQISHGLRSKQCAGHKSPLIILSSTHSIQECPCCTDSSGILLKQCTTAVLYWSTVWKIGKVSDPCMFQNWPCPQGNHSDYSVSTHIKLHNSFGMMLWNIMYLSVLNPLPDILWI